VAKYDPNPIADDTAPTGRNSDKYQRILDAAVAVFAEKGFFNSRVADVADRADVADGTVYLYFKSKEEILMTAINTAFDAFMGLARTELKKLPDPAERLRRLAFLHLDALGTNRNLAVVFQMELRQSTRFLAEFSHQHMVEYLRLVREHRRPGRRYFPPRDVRQGRGQLLLRRAGRNGHLLGLERARISTLKRRRCGGRHFS
jgi:TetR/AcrR family fatty acid metabolism transcriptional regulator